MTILDPDWRAKAACIGMPTVLFFPEDSQIISKTAKRVCASCGVRQECLEYALANFEMHGFWGGTSPKERRPLRSQYFKLVSVGDREEQQP